MTIRPYTSADCPVLAELFYNTVHTVNAADYSREQLDAWATGTVDMAAWDASFLAHRTLIAEEHGVILGFADMDETGYLDRLYVHAEHQRRGIASALCDALESGSAVKTFTTQASITARPFFGRRGYTVVKAQQVERHGVKLTNFVMKKEGNAMPEYRIRPAVLEDMPRLGHIMARSFRAAFAALVSQQTLEQCAVEENCAALLEGLCREGRMRLLTDGTYGMLVWMLHDSGEAEIMAIHTLPESWGTGLGHALLTRGLADIGDRPVFLWAFEENRRARRFYEKHGLRFDGTMRTSEFDGAKEVRYVLNP